MEVLAVAKLKYKEPEYGSDKLILEIKFKEAGKLFRTKIERVLVASYYWDRETGDCVYEENFNDLLLYYVNDKILLKTKVEEEVKEYFEKKKMSMSEKDKLRQFKKQLKEFGQIHVKVDIEE